MPASEMHKLKVRAVSWLSLGCILLTTLQPRQGFDRVTSIPEASSPEPGSGHKNSPTPSQQAQQSQTPQSRGNGSSRTPSSATQRSKPLPAPSPIRLSRPNPEVELTLDHTLTPQQLLKYWNVKNISELFDKLGLSKYTGGN